MAFSGKLERQEINALPLRAYGGKIFVINTMKDVKSSCHVLQKEKILGFDTETRPAFRKGEHHFPSLIQIAGEKSVFIFQLSQVGFPKPVKRILSDGAILKCGVALEYDLSELNKLSAFAPQGFVDLGELARKSFIPHHGLRGLTAYFLHFRISKQARTTNWNVKTLSKKQVSYAATDAWVGRELYFKFQDENLI
ncbi:MAG: 3'-5' exonuclease [Candidatus Marinimicrobia bacterium]|jgi:ribonuclease D|nr:3'-5' exonuclease [Candidatus Neomarinimicrobiota bacterium]|tara:strand:+ start:986 stop:1570 length:585 start_codon:yes stop_codon:yes gene_type:complete